MGIMIGSCGVHVLFTININKEVWRRRWLDVWHLRPKTQHHRISQSFSNGFDKIKNENSCPSHEHAFS